MSNFDGGPAFPVIGEHGMKLENDPGMTLRDYFAAAALRGIVASDGFTEASIGVSEECGATVAAKCAYLFADAMLKERLK